MLPSSEFLEIFRSISNKFLLIAKCLHVSTIKKNKQSMFVTKVWDRGSTGTENMH